MELSEGVFVSSLATDDFAEDPDVPGTKLHVLFDRAGRSAGLSRVVDAGPPVVWDAAERRGAARRGRSGAHRDQEWPETLELGVGDMASLPAGAETTWHLTVPFKEFWVLG